MPTNNEASVSCVINLETRKPLDPQTGIRPGLELGLGGISLHELAQGLGLLSGTKQGKMAPCFLACLLGTWENSRAVLLLAGDMGLSTSVSSWDSRSPLPPLVLLDGLAVVTLVGIIVGVLLAIGVVGGLTVVVMRKISGRFS